MSNKSGKNTLLMSVVMSSPGPIVVGLGLLAGRSSTQLADFIRRSAELLAIIAAYVIYKLTSSGGQSAERKARLERFSNLFVGAVMCLSGSIMLLIALFVPNADKGNVIPGLVIAVLGVIANSIFWVRYSKLGKQSGNAILLVQSRLYRAKTLVDGCVTIALASVALFPQSSVSGYLDTIGSVIVAAYLVWCGVKTVLEASKK